MKFPKKSAKDARKEKKLNMYAALSDLTIINYITNAKNVKKDN